MPTLLRGRLSGPSPKLIRLRGPWGRRCSARIATIRLAPASTIIHPGRRGEPLQPNAAPLRDPRVEFERALERCFADGRQVDRSAVTASLPSSTRLRWRSPAARSRHDRIDAFSSEGVRSMILSINCERLGGTERPAGRIHQKRVRRRAHRRHPTNPVMICTQFIRRTSPLLSHPPNGF